MTGLFTTLLAALLSLGAMSQKQTENKSPEGKWIISFLLMEGKLSDISGKAYELEFRMAEGQMGAKMCNSMGGNFTIDGKKMSFGPMRSTKMMCPDFDYETAFGQAIMQVDNFSFEKNRMMVKKGNEILLVLSMPVN
jgi:heat shock protein HslJ